MQKSKFFTLLRALGTEELPAFGKYINLLHQKEEVPLSIFNYCKKYFHDEGNQWKLEREYAYRKIFGEPIEANPYNTTRWLNALYDLHLWLKEFLMRQHFQVRSVGNELIWLSILKERRMQDEFFRKAARLKSEVETMPRKSVLDYLDGMKANYFLYDHAVPDKLSGDIPILRECANDLDLYFAISRLKLACEMENRKHLLSLPYDLEAMPAVIALVEGKEIAADPLFQLYKRVFELLRSWDDSRFFDLEGLLRKNMDQIAPDEIQDISAYLLNYAGARIRQGDENFWEVTHRINKIVIEFSIFERTSQMTANKLNNIVNTACRAKDFDWARQFIYTHQRFLPEKEREAAVVLAESLVLTAEKKFKQALEGLAGIEPPDLFSAIRIKSLMLICHYELEDSSVDVVGLCIAFEGYLKRNRKPRLEAVEATLRFVRVVKMLARGKVAKEVIIQEIEGAASIYFKSWLLEKAGER